MTTEKKPAVKKPEKFENTKNVESLLCQIKNELVALNEATLETNTILRQLRCHPSPK